MLSRLLPAGPNRRQVLDAASAFMGGTLFLGLTCSALTAGVMAIGLQAGEIETSPIQVVRTLTRMTFGGNAFDENINKFNRSMNAGYRLSKWFAAEFGSTQCRAITQCDFSTAAGVESYIAGDRIARCREITENVAERVQRTLREMGAVLPASRLSQAGCDDGRIGVDTSWKH